MTLDDHNTNESHGGDSGMLSFVEDPNSPGDYYAMGSVSGEMNRYEDLTYIATFGPQGYTIYDIYDKAWRQQPALAACPFSE